MRALEYANLQPTVEDFEVLVLVSADTVTLDQVELVSANKVELELVETNHLASETTSWVKTKDSLLDIMVQLTMTAGQPRAASMVKGATALWQDDTMRHCGKSESFGCRLKAKAQGDQRGSHNSTP